MYSAKEILLSLLIVSDMIPRFAKPVPVLSMITNTVADFIYNTHGHRIMQWNNFLLDQLKLEQYAVAVAEKGAALDNCYGFIDGTVRPICRPPKGCLQWPQKSTRNQVPVCHCTIWNDSSDLWPSW